MDAHYFLTNDRKKNASGKMMIEEAISGKRVRGVIDNLKPFSLDTTPLVPPRSFSVNGLELYDAGFSFTNK